MTKIRADCAVKGAGVVLCHDRIRVGTCVCDRSCGRRRLHREGQLAVVFLSES